ncbi:hypothetical protein HYQ45_009866 [Verticillium longisporum]|uniref:Uncharacterized protein n=1 Tax=Verticillium longisporum TaxID=100787 RepID=A0A8I2ZKV4_VERLO|nr:hypothetical protein HYQ45_009866 [Verticillium longisporum]
MQRADSPGPTELDGLIERAYQEFADVTELLADEQRDAEAAASAEVPVLQQMIDLKQKEVEQLEPRVLQLKTEQEAARQKIASLNARVEAARGRSRRVATLAGRVSGKIMSSTRPQSPKLAKSSNARQLRQNNTGSSAHPRRSSGVSTSSEAGRLPLEAPKDARLACGETSSSCSLIPSRSIEVSEPRAALSLPDSPGITIGELLKGHPGTVKGTVSYGPDKLLRRKVRPPAPGHTATQLWQGYTPVGTAPDDTTAFFYQ